MKAVELAPSGRNSARASLRATLLVVFASVLVALSVITVDHTETFQDGPATGFSITSGDSTLVAPSTGSGNVVADIPGLPLTAEQAASDLSASAIVLQVCSIFALLMLAIRRLRASPAIESMAPREITPPLLLPAVGIRELWAGVDRTALCIIRT